MSTRRLSMNESLKNARIFDSDSDEESFIAALKKEKEKRGDVNRSIEISSCNVEVSNVKKEVTCPIIDEDSSSTASIEKTLLKAIHIKQETSANDENIHRNISICESKNSIHIKAEKPDNTDEIIHTSVLAVDSKKTVQIKPEKIGRTDESIYASTSEAQQTFDTSKVELFIKKEKKDGSDSEEEASAMDIEMQTPVKKEYDCSDSLENETLSGLYIITPAKAETPPSTVEQTSKFKDVIVAKRRLNKPDSMFSNLEKIDEQISEANGGPVNNLFTRRSTRTRGSPYKLPENDNSTGSLARRGVKRESPYKRPDEVTRDTPVMKRNTNRYYGELNRNIDLDQTVPRKRSKSHEVEADPEVLARRQKQIDFGKNTIGYDNYIKLIPIQNRDRNDPQTPDKYRKYSRRGWDGLIRQWRIQLHKYDPEACGDEDE